MNNSAKPIRVTRSSMPPFEEYVETIRGIWDSRWLTNMGDLHQELEKNLKEYLGVSNLSLFTNGHLALETLLQAMNLEGEVITTPFTFISTTHAIVRNGLTPVFCDIREDDYTMNADLLESLITDKTCAIVPVHVYGNPCEVEKIQKIADRHGLKVIYDAAHAFGERIDGTGIAAFGDASMFSFHATKVFHTIEGGAAIYRDESLAHAVNGLKNFGIMDEETVELVGGNAKMNEFQAAMGLCNLKHLEEELEKRRAAVERYRERLSGIPGIRLCEEKPGVVYNHAYMPVVFDDWKENRDEVFHKLEKQNIFARKYFYPCANACQCYEDRFDPKDTPVADRISKQVLTLPMFSDLTPDMVDRICDVILG